MGTGCTGGGGGGSGIGSGAGGMGTGSTFLRGAARFRVATFFFGAAFRAVFFFGAAFFFVAFLVVARSRGVTKPNNVSCTNLFIESSSRASKIMWAHARSALRRLAKYLWANSPRFDRFRPICYGEITPFHADQL